MQADVRHTFMQIQVCFLEPKVTQKCHELLLARESYGAEAGHLLGVPWVARLNQHNTEVGVLSCHTR